MEIVTPAGILLLTLLIAVLIGGFMAALLNAFGTWIIFLGTFLYAYLTGFQIVPSETLWILGGLALLGEIAEQIFSHMGIKKMGGSTRSVAGAFMGGVAGGVIGTFFFGIGVVLGGLLGIFFGAYIMEMTRSGDWGKSFKVGIGGLIGVAGSLITKILIALVMIEVVVSRFIR